ncbi:MAG: hypothetical protein HN348_19435 [Proteobacteria bacterium]|nr:hypothetical protein [Pseudomonadota bacterium]
MRRLVLVILGTWLLACGGVGSIPSGPVYDQQGNQIWTDAMGHQTIIEAGTGNMWFAHNNQFLYGVNPQGQFHAVTPQGVVPIVQMPPELAQWPMPQAQAQAQQGYQQQPQGYQLPQGYQANQQQGWDQGQAWDGGGGMDQGTFDIMMDINNMNHETNMNIINNMVSDPIDYYEDNQYIGTW